LQDAELIHQFKTSPQPGVLLPEAVGLHLECLDLELPGFPLFRIKAVLPLTFRAKFGALSGAQLVIAKGFVGG